MKNAQSKVRAFHRKFGQAVRTKPGQPTDAERHARSELVREEFEEFDEELRHGELVDIAREGSDLIYCVLGAFVECGLEVQPFFDAIHRANMTKVRGRGSKAQKPKGFKDADLGKILKEQTR